MTDQQAGSTGTGEPDDAADTAEVDAMAGHVVEMLGLERAIKLYERDVHKRLIDADRQAENAPVNADMMFIALSLPMVNGLIHFASTRSQLNEARNWVRNRWREEEERLRKRASADRGVAGGAEPPRPDDEEIDPLSTLSALTLIYIVNHTSSQFPDDVPMWQQIRRRVHRLKQDYKRDHEQPVT